LAEGWSGHAQRLIVPYLTLAAATLFILFFYDHPDFGLVAQAAFWPGVAAVGAITADLLVGKLRIETV
jgi:hypothetical protein